MISRISGYIYDERMYNEDYSHKIEKETVIVGKIITDRVIRIIIKRKKKK
jgi:hypothetical protein